MRSKKLFAGALVLTTVLLVGAAAAQDGGGGQSRESMAVDATASQWSFQFALEGNFDYKTDEIAPGVMRPEGGRGFLQYRMVAPIPKSESFPVTLLPRLTLRAVESGQKDWGLGQSDVFILTIINQWAKGRWGLGPQINFPAAKRRFGNPEWGYGLAGAVTQRELNDKLFLALLLQQTWSKDPAGSGDTKASPLGINAILVYQLGSGYYLGNGDFVIRYNWDDSAWFIPLRVRFGRAFIKPDRTWNTYIEYGTALSYSGWQGAVPNHTVRINVQMQIPVSF